MCFRKAVLVIHGFIGGTYDNEYLVNYLQYQRGLDVYAFTLPGHEKAFVSGVKYHAWIKESENQIEHLIKKYKKIYVIGHSMGGVIASHLATKYPQVKKLILVAPAFEYISHQQNLKDIPNISKIIQRDDNQTAYEIILSKILLVPLPTVIQFTKLIKHYKATIKEVCVPTLIIHGDIDEVVPLKSSDYAYDNIKTTKKYKTILTNVRHAVFRSERQEEISNYVYKFIKGGFSLTRKYKSIL